MRISTTKKFDKQFKKQPKNVQKKFREKVKIFLKNKQHASLRVHKLSGKLQNLWSFNVTGDIRVIFDDSMQDLVLLVAIGSHSELYT